MLGRSPPPATERHVRETAEMSAPAEIHQSVSRLILDHCRSAYDDEAGTWRDLGALQVNSNLGAGRVERLS